MDTEQNLIGPENPNRHDYLTTRTSPFGYYGECWCGWLTKQYRPTAREAWQDVMEHVGAAR